MNALAGVSHILITPFTSAEQVDHHSLAAVVRAAIDAGVSSVVALGIMGEAHKLTDSERKAVIRTAISEAGPATPVVVGVSAESTVAAIRRAEEAVAEGAAYLMLAPPRGSGGPQLVDHYARVGQATPAGLIVQDEPVFTGVTLPPAFFASVSARIPTLVAAKVEESPSPSKISAIAKAAPGLDCLGGLGGVSLLEELERGAIGTMTGFAVPSILREIYNAFVIDGRDAARAAFHRYLPLIRFEAQLGAGGVGIRKQIFFERGIIRTAIVRAPSAPLDRETVRELRELLVHFGIFVNARDRDA